MKEDTNIPVHYNKLQKRDWVQSLGLFACTMCHQKFELQTEVDKSKNQKAINQPEAV